MNLLRGYLTRDALRGRGCDRPDHDADPAARAARSMAARLDAQATAWPHAARADQRADGTLLTEPGRRAHEPRHGRRPAWTRHAPRHSGEDRTTLAKVLADINDARQEADDTADDLTSLADHVTGVESRYSTAQSALAAALTDAKHGGLHRAGRRPAAGDQGRRRPGRCSRARTSKSAFTSSSQGLAAAADELPRRHRAEARAAAARAHPPRRRPARRS